MRFCYLLLAFSTTCFAAESVGEVRRIFIEPLASNLDQYIRVEIMKQGKDRLSVALDKADADAVLTGVSAEKKGVVHMVGGRLLGLEDNATAVVSLVNPSGTKLLWSGEAGDRSQLLVGGGLFRRGGQQKVAERIVRQLLVSIPGKAPVESRLTDSKRP